MSLILSALINGIIASPIIVAVVWLVMRFTSIRLWNAATRYVVWWATLLVTIIIPALYVPIPWAPLMDRASSQPVLRGVGLTSVEIETNPSLPHPMSSREAISVGGPQTRRNLFPIRVSSGPWIGWVGFVWITGTLFMLVRLIASYVMIERRKKRACSLPAHETRLQGWLDCCGAGRKRVSLAVSPDIRTPMAVGPYRPSILLPARMLDLLDGDELDQVGLHEAAHIGRYDDYALIFQRILQALFVFHPVVAWIARRIDLEREMACDDVVVQVTGDPVSYASCLTHVAELAGGVSVSGLTASAAAAESHLEKRVEILIDSTCNRVTRLLKLRLAGTMAVLGLMACMASRVPALIVLAAPLAPLLGEQRQAPPLASSPSEPFPSVRTPNGAPESVVVAGGKSSQRLVQQPQESNSTTFASPPPSVWVPVVVTEPQHRYVSGLAREHFKIFEDNAQQEITEFVAPTSELSVAVVEDIRNGNAELQMAREAEKEFQRNSSPKDEFWLKSGQASGPSALLDRVRLGLEELRSASNRRRIVLIVSDSDDRSTPDTADQVAMLAGTADISIYAISLTQESPVGVAQAVAPSDAGILDMLVKQSGGRHFMVADQGDISEVAKKISIELRNGYLLGYQPKNTLRDGTYRQILVQLQPPRGIPQLVWINRPGYFSSKQGR